MTQYLVKYPDGTQSEPMSLTKVNQNTDASIGEIENILELKVGESLKLYSGEEVVRTQ